MVTHLQRHGTCQVVSVLFLSVEVKTLLTIVVMELGFISGVLDPKERERYRFPPLCLLAQQHFS